VRDLGYTFHDASSHERLPADLSRAARRIRPGESINVVGRA
jgi:hypothetical protein